MDVKEIISNAPVNLNEFKGQFVLFFSEDVNPEVLYSSFVAEEAYKKAEEIKKEQGREPVVIRVPSSVSNDIAQMLAARF